MFQEEKLTFTGQKICVEISLAFIDKGFGKEYFSAKSSVLTIYELDCQVDMLIFMTLHTI